MLLQELWSHTLSGKDVEGVHAREGGVTAGLMAQMGAFTGDKNTFHYLLHVLKCLNMVRNLSNRFQCQLTIAPLSPF